MKALAIRSLVAVAALTVLAAAATPAHATVTPVNQQISATSSDSVFSSTDGLVTNVRCPTAHFLGTITGATQISGRLDFSIRTPGGTTCTANVMGVGTVSIDPISCSITLRSVSSVAGAAASFDLVVDAPCVVNSSGVFTYSIDAQTVRGCVTYSQATQSMTFNCTNIVATLPPARGISRTVTFRGSYSVAVRTRMTIS